MGGIIINKQRNSNQKCVIIIIHMMNNFLGKTTARLGRRESMAQAKNRLATSSDFKMDQQKDDEKGKHNRKNTTNDNILVRFYKRYVMDNCEQNYDCDNFSKL